MSIEQVTQSFLSEAAEILEDLEERLLALEDDPAAATVDAIFRALHTVKGSGAMFGFSELSGFAHHFETEFEAVRSGQRPVTGELVGAALAACDVLTALLSLPPGSDEARQTASGPRAQAALEALSCAPGDETGGGADEDAGGGRTASPATWRVTYRPAPSDLRNGARPDLLVAELLELGTGTARPLPDRVPRLENLDPEESTLAWVIEVGGEIGRSDIEDVFVFSDAAEIAVE